MHDWAEVHRLHEREGCSKTAIARRFGMSRNTVDRLLRLTDPPTYERRSRGSLLDPFKLDIAEEGQWSEDGESFGGGWRPNPGADEK